MRSVRTRASSVSNNVPKRTIRKPLEPRQLEPKWLTLEHFFAISPQTIPCTEAVYDMLRKIHGRPIDDPVEDLDVNVAIWEVFINALHKKAAVHLGNDHDVNSFWRSTGKVFGETEKWISGQTETGMSLIDSRDPRWISTSLLYSGAYQYANAKVYVFPDSVLCVSGRNKLSIIQKPITSANSIELMENPWGSSGRSSKESRQWASSERFRKMMGELQCDPAGFKGRMIFMSMLNDIVWDAKGSEELCENNSKRVEEYARRFPRGHWSFLGPGSEKKWYGTHDGKPDGSWNRTAEKMRLNFKKCGHPIFRCTSALEKGELRSKGGGRTTIHFTASDDNVQLLQKNGHLRQSVQSFRSSSGFD